MLIKQSGKDSNFATTEKGHMQLFRIALFMVLQAEKNEY